jgi:hypothetical protein
MTAQAIIHQILLAIVVIIQKYLFVSGGVRARRPIRILLLVTFLATIAHAQHIIDVEPNLLGYLTAQVGRQATNVLEVKT